MVTIHAWIIHSVYIYIFIYLIYLTFLSPILSEQTYGGELRPNMTNFPLDAVIVVVLVPFFLGDIMEFGSLFFGCASEF